MATDFREEHRQTLDWLNDLAKGDVRFFGIEIGAAKIGDSLTAPLFKLRAQPNEWHAVISTSAKATSEGGGKAEAYRAFWTRFIERVHSEHPWVDEREGGFWRQLDDDEVPDQELCLWGELRHGREDSGRAVHRHGHR